MIRFWKQTFIFLCGVLNEYNGTPIVHGMLGQQMMSVWGGLRGTALLEEVCHGEKF